MTFLTVESMSTGDAGSWSYMYKLVTIGDTGCGKTSLLVRFVTQQFDPHVKSTIGVDHYSTVVKCHGDDVKVQLWDNSGAIRFRSMVKVYFRAAPGALVVYDVTNRDSFDNVMAWVNEVRQYALPDVAILLVGNKTDLESRRAVTTAEGAELAAANRLMFLETSALTDSNVHEAFRQVVAHIHKGKTQLSGRLNSSDLPPGITVDLNKSTAPRRTTSSCCSFM